MLVKTGEKLVHISVTVYDKTGETESGQFWITKTRPQTILKTAKMVEKMGINRIADDPVLNRLSASLQCALCKYRGALAHKIRDRI